MFGIDLSIIMLIAGGLFILLELILPASFAFLSIGLGIIATSYIMTVKPLSTGTAFLVASLLSLFYFMCFYKYYRKKDTNDTQDEINSIIDPSDPYGTIVYTSDYKVVSYKGSYYKYEVVKNSKEPQEGDKVKIIKAITPSKFLVEVV